MVKQLVLLLCLFHQKFVQGDIAGVNAIQIDLLVGNDGGGLDAHEFFHTCADVVQAQGAPVALKAEDGAAGQVVGHGFKPLLGRFAL